MYCIYRITNCINGKTYIGQHKYKKTPYDKYMGSGKHLKRAQKKYGIENFVKGIIIDSIDDKCTADSLERDYIAFEREHNINGCYNITDGGQGGNLGEEVNRKLSEAAKGRKGERNPMYGKPGTMLGKHLSEETKRKMAEAKKGKPGYWKGKKRGPPSEETKRKIVESNKGKRWFNNGKVNVYRFECPVGFIPGRLK